MKKLSIIIILIFLSLVGVQAQDTITVEVDKNVKVLIYSKTREGLKKLKNVDLNKILGDVVEGLPKENNNLQDTVKLVDNSELKIYEYEYNPDTDSFTLVETNEEERTKNKTIIKNKRHTRKTRRFWAFDIGTSQYFEDGDVPSADRPYSLGRTLFTYVGFGAYQRYRIGGERSPFSIQAGVDINWYNFIFEDNNYIFKTDNGVAFGDYQEDFGENLNKSKLTVAYFNIPLTLNLRFKNKRGRNIFGIGGGGYVGTRIGSHSKTKVGNDRDRDRGSFFLNNWRYGWEAQLSIANVLLFFKYDLNPLFEDNKGPELNAFSIGVRL